MKRETAKAMHRFEMKYLREGIAAGKPYPRERLEYYADCLRQVIADPESCNRDIEKATETLGIVEEALKRDIPCTLQPATRDSLREAPGVGGSALVPPDRDGLRSGGPAR